jgi:molybdopterin biosynthesis enzyme
MVKVPYSIAEDAVYNATVITATSGTSTAAFDTTADIIAKPGADFTPDYTANVDPGNLITYTHVLTTRAVVRIPLNSRWSPRSDGAS